MMNKFNMWASGFCTCGFLYSIFISHSISFAILTGLFAIANLIFGIMKEN